MATSVHGAAQQWQTLAIDFTGPTLSEQASTFTDYRLDVTFRHSSGATYTVPGYFAADGNAADSNATSGTVWRVNFNAPMSGDWTYTASFRTGDNVAASLSPTAGTATGFNGATGKVSIAAASTKAADGLFATDGMVVQQGHYLVHKGSGDLFLKAGSDSPENFLAFDGFDGTKSVAGRSLLDFDAHARDWDSGDPTWDGGKGKEIIGAVNYLADKGINAQYMLTMNVGGDGKDVYPWGSDAAGDRLKFDVSKLDQWETVFQHMDDKGMLIHLVTQETENDQLLGGMTTERMIYYRELVARFGHHNGLIWNLGEENSNTTTERKAFADYIKALDPYDHPVVIHNWPGTEDSVFGPLLGDKDHDGVSMQRTNGVREEVAQWVTASAKAGDSWLVMWDETGPAGTGIVRDGASGAATNHATLRANMWGALTAGAAGIEWYAGGEDHTLDDFRTRDSVWTWTAAAKDFFQTYLPVAKMQQADALTTGTNVSDYVIAQPGSVYAIYLPKGGTASLNLAGQSGSYDVDWFNPRTGGALRDGNVTSVKGGGTVSLGNAPADAGQDWVILVRKSGGTTTPTDPKPSDGQSSHTLTGTDKGETLKGSSLTDHLIGLGGNDLLDGGTGADRMEGGSGNDQYNVDTTGDVVVELTGQGTDLVNSWISYTLGANVENLYLRGGTAIDGTGNALANELTGNDSINRLFGGDGADKLTGRGGADLLTGGAGKDRFDYNLLSESRGTTADTILDFKRGEDVIDVSSIDANTGIAGDQAFRFLGSAAFTGQVGELRYQQSGGQTHVYADLNGDKQADFLVHLQGSHALAASDFLL